MVAFPDQSGPALRLGQTRQDRPARTEASSLACFVKTFAGAGLCMAALGLWLVPSLDPAAQLTKLCGSLLLLGIGAYLLHMRKAPNEPVAEPTTGSRKVRTHEYDAKGRAKLRA